MELYNEKLQTKTPFLDLTRDYGFKIVFADQDRKELMIGFLNKIITERNIIDIRFLNTDILAPEEDGKSPNYDISCKDGRRLENFVGQTKFFIFTTTCGKHLRCSRQEQR